MLSTRTRERDYSILIGRIQLLVKSRAFGVAETLPSPLGLAELLEQPVREPESGLDVLELQPSALLTQNDFADHQESPAAIYVDDVYVSQMAGLAFSLFDSFVDPRWRTPSRTNSYQ